MSEHDGREVRSPSRLAVAAIALATALTLLGLAIPLFLNPVWVSAEQDRARADAWTGYSTSEVHRVTDAILHDLVLGPPTFAMTDDAGRPVLDARERAHMRDVRDVFGVAVAAIAAAAIALVVSALPTRRGSLVRRLTFWRGVRAGARGLAVTVVALGALSLVAFDAAFELFHELFFAGGTYTFDPRTERLVQLFPDQFWSETTLALGAALLVLAFVADRIAGRGLERAGSRASHARDGSPEAAGSVDAGRSVDAAGSTEAAGRPGERAEAAASR
ncbi:MAG TPA: DUF1461 domain-containing protein [Candidatus Limnocylindrales bacterium]|nr:DUF1461 domain-containing protein [Candidatus Limnocylindrales bacterium]